MGTDSSSTYWNLYVRNLGNEGIRVRAWATCAKVGQ